MFNIGIKWQSKVEGEPITGHRNRDEEESYSCIFL